VTAGALLVALTLLVGAFIGSVGVGGVLLGPALVLLGVAGPHEAAATSTWAFIVTGVIGTVVYARSSSIDWPMLARIAVGVVPAAFLGARANALLAGDAVLVLLGLLTLAVGAQQLAGRRRRAHPTSLGTGRLVLVGAVVGFGSAITGTGGPVLLVPILLTLGVAPLTAVAVSQAAQLPVVGAASVGYLQAGLTDVRLGTVIGLVAGLGVLLGARLARRADPHRLARAVAVACVLTGVLLLVRAVAGRG
jgi:uncharacterized membrane protein YfcA